MNKLIQYKIFLDEIYNNQCGKLFDPIVEVFFDKNSVEKELYTQYMNSGQYIELPHNDYCFRRKIYEKFISEYVVKHYKNDPDIKRFLGYLKNSGDDHERYENNYDYLCEQMKLKSESSKFFREEFARIVRDWCNNNNISYYG